MIDIDLALFRAEESALKAWRDYELQVRRVANGDVQELVDQLIPDTSVKWKQRNQDTTNHFTDFLDKIKDAITTGELSWDYAGQSDAQDEIVDHVLRARTDIIADAVTDILVGGRFVLFPYLSERTKAVEVAVLSGWCVPMFDPENSNLITSVVQVTTEYEGITLKYRVRVYTDNMLTVYPLLADWTHWTTSRPQDEYNLTYADGLPVVPVIVRRGPDRSPKGLATDALPGFRRYLKDAINYNAAAELYGRPETLVASDHYLSEARNAPNSQLLKQLREKGPAALKIISTDDRYENLPPVDLEVLRTKQDVSLDELASSLKVPNIAARELSGLALQEIRTAFTHTVNSYADAISRGLALCMQMAARIPGSKLPQMIDIDLKPQFSQDIANERKTVIDAFNAGVISRSQGLVMLQQLGMSGITDEAINDEMAIEKKQYQERLTAPDPNQVADQTVTAKDQSQTQK